ncbi:MAG: hypothetical protein ACM3UZ_03570 [Acidobacteriota bacterium]
MAVGQEVQTLLAMAPMRTLFSGLGVTLVEISAAITLLVTAAIPFDLTYSPGTRRIAPAFEMIVYINPTTTLNLTIPLTGGTTLFTTPPSSG